jgi:hypothetical protein
LNPLSLSLPAPLLLAREQNERTVREVLMAAVAPVEAAGEWPKGGRMEKKREREREREVRSSRRGK